MNPYNSAILAAKKKQQRVFLGLVLSALLIIIVVLSVIFVSRGTRIEIQPADAATEAKVAVSNGIAMVFNDSVYSLSSAPEISINTEGFYPYQRTLNEKDFGKVITLVLKPLPATLSLSTAVNDDQTVWLIDDELITQANAFNYELPAGSYQLTVQHPYFSPTERDLVLARGEHLEETIELNRLQGEIDINSSPSGANVTVNGEEKGQTPLQLTLAGGVHQLQLTLAGYEPTDENIELTYAAPKLERRYQLEPVRADINLRLQPDGGRLTVNGIHQTNMQRLNVEAGREQRLIYSKLGYFSQSKTLTVKAGERAEVAMTLQQEIGKVEIESSPAAQIEINGEIVGNSPLSVSLQAVPQEITFSLPGYRSVTQTVTPSATSPQKVSKTLLTENQARLAEAPRRYQHTVGGELLLFVPNDIIKMGAPRGEAGQRANEFLKQVRLSKPFYAGTHEVTNAEYRQFRASHAGDAQLPATNVTWTEAAQFCNWLSEQEGFTPVYQFDGNQLTRIHPNVDGYRLLTEAEWEWLARKVGKAEQTRFVWGNDTIIPEKAANIADESARANVSEYVARYTDGYATVAPVKSFSREASGLYDMAGNVSEWVHDSYVLTWPNADRIYDHTLDLATETMRVVKGANWRSGSLTTLRASYREGGSQASDDLGFRIGRFIY